MKLKRIILTAISAVILTGFNIKDAPEPEKQDDNQEQHNVITKIFSSFGLGGYSLNPNGQRLIHYKFDGHKYHYYVQDIESTNEKVFIEIDSPWIGEGSFKVEWLDNDNVIAQFFNPLTGWTVFNYHIIAENGDIDFKETSITNDYFVVDSLPLIKNQAIFGKRYDKGGSLIFKANIQKKHFLQQLKPRNRLNRGVEDFDEWLFDKNGEPIVAFKKENDIVTVKHKRYGKWRELFTSQPEQLLLPVSLSPDNRYLNLILSIDDANHLKKYDLEDLEYTSKSYKLATKDIVGAQFNKYTGEVLSVSQVVNGIHELEFIHSKHESEFELIRTQIKNKNFHITDQTFDGKKAILITQQSDDPGEYYIYDSATETIKFIGYSQPDTADINFQSSIIIHSTSPDGLEIESYLLPSALSPEKSPLIVMPHGGPIGVRDYTYYDRYAQGLSQLGYNILQPNYRGSSGFGKSFLEAGKHQWGKMIEEDIRAATHKAIKELNLDKNRVCIFGISYGGYSALMSAIKYPEEYQCAASFAGVTDLTLLYSKYNIHVDEELKEFFLAYIGDPETNIKELIEYSPAYNLDKLNLPVFISQGGNDPIVDMEHYFRVKYLSEYMEKDNFEFAFYVDARHGFRRIDTILSFFERLDTFFKKHLN